MTRLRLVGAVIAIASLPAFAQAASTSPVDAPVPNWAQSRWQQLATTRGLSPATRVQPNAQRGDFDGDGVEDFALLVRSRAGKEGIVIFPGNGAAPIVVGAGRTLGNGGDDFSWMDSWSVDRRASRTKGPKADRLLLEKESSASAFVYIERGKARWLQQGD